jgi:hypothetical protein
MTLDGHNVIETARWLGAAKQHGYQNAISRWPWAPIPVTERDRTGKHDDVRYYPEPAPINQRRPEHQRPKFGGRQKPRYQEAA